MVKVFLNSFFDTHPRHSGNVGFKLYENDFESDIFSMHFFLYMKPKNISEPMWFQGFNRI